MRRVLRSVYGRLPLYVLCLYAATAEMAGAKPLSEFAASELWFNSLSAEQRTDVQNWLIWTGDYNHLVDGTFGSSTHKAIRDFEKRNGTDRDGALDADELSKLRRLADEEQRRTGFQMVHDDKW